MAEKKDNLILNNQLFGNSTEQFLGTFENLVSIDIHEGTKLDFEVERLSPKKICPMLRLANPEDAEDITKVYVDCYKGTYPYKEMEDVSEIKKMIKSNNYLWILFKSINNKTIGCVAFVLDFKLKRGYLRGLAIKRKYQGNMDITKASIGCCFLAWTTHKEDIGIWYGEARTAHSKSQYLSAACGLKPIGFYPNKDVFMNKVESDLMIVVYNEDTIKKRRSKQIPQVLPEVINCFSYSNKRFHLGSVNISSPHLNFDSQTLSTLRNNLNRRISKDKFGYETIHLSINNSDSYFNFLFTPQVQNFEKAKYKVNSSEELFIYAEDFMKIFRELKARYCECFISAYNVVEQKIFLKAGLKPRGYIPCWEYNCKNDVFEDHVLFNHFKGEIDEKIKLIPEGRDLLENLDIIPF